MPEVWAETLKRLREDPSYSNMFHMMERFRDDVAAEVSDREDRIITRTYGEYILQAQKACGNIERAGYVQGDRIGLIYDTCMDWPVLFWGILMAGCIPVLMNPLADPHLSSGILNDADAKAYVSSKPLRECSCPWIPAESILRDGETGEERWGDYVALCTSGTTGSSRLFLYDSKTIAAHLLSFDEAKRKNVDMPFDETKPTKLLAFLPFHHVFGFSVVYILYSCTGKTLVYLRDKAPQTILGTCRRHKVTHLYCVPMFFNALAEGVKRKIDVTKPIGPLKKLIIQKNLLGTSIRSMIVGGVHVPEETLRIINSIGYPLCNGFGMTESGIVSVETSTDPEQRIKGSIGIPFSITEYRVVPEGAPVGELQIRGDALYTASIIDKQIVPRDRSKWFATGDLVSVRPDGLYMEGRIKDVIINSSGENVYPDELEDSFSGLPGVKKSCILGLKNGAYEEVVLVAEPGEDLNEASLTGEIRRINATLDNNRKVGRLLISRDALPVSGNMKVKRQFLKSKIENGQWAYVDLKLYGSGPAGKPAEEKPRAAVQAPAAQVRKPSGQDADYFGSDEFREITEEVKACVSKELRIDASELDENANLITELGGDSLSLFSVVSDIEQKYNIIIVDDEIMGLGCVRDMADYIYRKRHGLDIETVQPASSRETVRITDFAESGEYKAMIRRMEETFRGGYNPYFIPHDSLIRDTSVINGKRMINLGSYNYLGMSGNPETEEAAIEVIRKYGTSASGSRTLAGEKTLYRELEKEIAEWKHTEDAIVGTGGWATNLTFVSCFAREGDFIVYDQLSHNSLTEGIALSKADSKAFEHNNLKQLEDILRMVQGRYNKVLIIVEGVYSMDGDIAPIPEFVRLKKKYWCFLMVDEAHSGGVIGEHGGGVDDYFGLEPHDVDIKYGTLSKALGTCGGFIAADKSIVEYLRYNMNGFVFSAGIAPPLAAACKKAIEIIRRDNSEVLKLHRNIEYFVRRAKEEGMNTCLAGESAIVPVLIGDDADAVELSAKLMERGVFVPPAVYPAVPQGESRLRFTVSSTHSEEQLEKAIRELSALMHEKGFLK